ncbi:membrane-binding protein [Flavobacterium sp.]|uniref:toxin-antitoxin system YwqK family antitoxin n=1 Tax=Flavobacterium sp. TaxID=239 RepID=UPI00286E0A64|nr:membrane-binding protein [Flavobacterium sp.]
MKKMLLISMMMVSAVIFSQNTPVIENVDDVVTATYYYENGQVKQVGDFIDGKLEGKWISYSEDGTITAIAQYREGKKHGKWQYFESPYVTKIVDYKNNNIVKVVVINKNPVAYSN